MSKTYKFRLPQMKVHPDEYIFKDTSNILKDKDWVNLTQMSNTDEYDSDMLKFQYRSPVMSELMDTSIGGHFTLNPAYGFTPTADIYYKGRMLDATEFSPDMEAINIGMGRYYSEAIQQSSKVRTIIFELGVPEFQNIFSFAINAVDTAKLIIAREGRSPFFYYAGLTGGTAATFLAFPLFTAATLLMKYFVNKIAGLFDSKFYSLKPNMGAFWSTANTIMNTFTADRGILGTFNFITSPFTAKGKLDRQGYQIQLSGEDKKNLENMMPHIFKNNGTTHTEGLIDIAAISGRHQRLVSERIKLDRLAAEKGDAIAYVTQIKKPETKSLKEFVDELSKTEAFKARDPKERPITEAISSKDINPDDYKEPDDTGRRRALPQQDTSWFRTVGSYYRAAVENGTDVFALQVEYVGPTSMTINNSIKDIPLESLTNQASKKIRDIRFTIADGNFFGDTVNSIRKGVTDLIKGSIEGLTLGLSSLAGALSGGGFIEYPKMYDDSSVSFDGHTFKIRCNSPYNNQISQMMDIDMVLSVLLAASSPQSIGRSAYTSPYICKAFMRGIMNEELAMITRISLKLGEGNLGHNAFGAATDIEITFDVTSLQKVFSVPVPTGINGLYEVSLDSYSGINRFSKLLTGQSYKYSMFISKKILMRLNKQYGSINAVFSPEMWGTKLGHSFIGRAHTLFVDPELSSVALFDE